MRRKSKGQSVLFIGIFILSFVLAILAVRFLPIPANYQRLVFFLLIPLLSLAGVSIVAKISSRR